MTSRKIKEKRWETRRKLERDSRYPTNCIHIGQNESKEHQTKKFEVAQELINQGMVVVTEAKAKGKERVYDVVCLDTGNVHEIETDEEGRSLMLILRIL